MRNIFSLLGLIISLWLPINNAFGALSYKMELKNIVQLNECTIRFDVYLSNTSATPAVDAFAIEGGGFQITYNQAIVNGGSLNSTYCTYVANSTELETPNLLATIPNYPNMPVNGNITAVPVANPTMFQMYFNGPKLGDVLTYFNTNAPRRIGTFQIILKSGVSLATSKNFASVAPNLQLNTSFTTISTCPVVLADVSDAQDGSVMKYTRSASSFTTILSRTLANPSTQDALYSYCFTGIGNYSTSANWNNAATAGNGKNTLPTSGSNLSIGGWSTFPVPIALPGICSQDQAATLNNITITTGSTLNVNAGKQLTVSTGLNNNGTMNLLSDNTSGTATILTPATLTGNGTYNVNQFLTGTTGTSTRGMWYISSPVSGATSAVFDVVSSSPLNKLWSYAESLPTPAYIPITTNGTVLTPGTGYVANFAGADNTYIFTGPLNTANITLTPTRTGTTVASRGFNLIGNPYPAYLNWNAAKAVSTNLRPTIWYRTFIGGYMVFGTYDGTVGTNNASQYIPPMQAVWIKGNLDNVTCSIPLSTTMCSHQDQSSPTNRLRVPTKDEAQLLRLQISNGIISDEAVVLTDPKAKNSFDYYDSQKMSNNNVAIPEIYTLAGTEELVINHLKEIESNDELILGYRTGQYNTYSITATQINNFDADIKIIIKDNLLNTQKDLTDGTPYTFTSDVAATTSRFSIMFKSSSVTTGMNNQSGNTLGILISKGPNNNIIVNYNGDLTKISSLSVCNVLGQKLITKQITNSTTEIANLPTGVYLINVMIGGKVISQKVILN